MRTLIALSIVLALGALTGCTTSSRVQTDTTIADMQRRVEEMEPTVQESVAKLDETTATLAQRLEESERQNKELRAVADENQTKLAALEQELSAMKATFQGQYGATSGQIGIVPPNGQTIVTPPPAQDLQAQYKAAQQTYAANDYAKAVQLFDALVRQYPQSDIAPGSQFWKAKANLQLQKYPEAIQDFETLRATYPNDPKIPFAMHNEAVATARMGEKEKAKQLLNQLIQSYPLTAAADAAKKDLAALQ